MRADRGTARPPVAVPEAAARADCVSTSESLAAAARGEHSVGPAQNEHLAACLRCRAEQLRYRRMMEAMRTMRDAPLGHDPRVESQILGHLAAHRERPGGRALAQAATAVGGAAAGAAAAVGVIALAARHRRGAVLTP